MKIVEGIQATGDHVWIVIESAVDGKEVETGFRTKAEAKNYRAALLAYRQSPDRRLLMSIERLRRSAIITYGHDRKTTHGAARKAAPLLSQKETMTGTLEVPENVLEAIIEFVRLQRILNPDAPDEEDFFLNHLPVLCDWLEGLGRLPPYEELPPLDTEVS